MRYVKRPDRTLSKRVRLSPKGFHHRLALEHSNFRADAIDFDGYYAGLKDVQSNRDKAWLWNSLVLGALFLYKFGDLEEFSFFGISTDQSVIGYLLFLLFAVSSLLFSSQQAKIVRYQSIFNAAHDTSRGADKQHLILKYPRAYSPFTFANWMSGGPRFMYPAKKFPIRVILLLAAMFPALLAWVGFIIWLLISVSLQLWRDDASVFGEWAKVVVLSGWATMAATLLLPTLAFRKIEFDHYGLGQMLEKVRQNDLPRYQRYLRMIARTKHGQEFFGAHESQKPPTR